jgi:hypothetical protein
MARQRRGGFRTPELRGTLGTLLRTTREVLTRGAREGRERLDEALSGRRRTDALAELGEIVLDLVRRGELDANDLPEARDVLMQLDELDAGHPTDDAREIARAPSRDRFDDRPRPPSRRDDADDGTVTANTWSPPTRAKPSAKVWRPPAVAAAPAPDDAPPPARRAIPKPGQRKGGISFEDDDSDLADYMHPDDVPKKDEP